MHLLLWRHAEAGTAPEDQLRALTARGQDQAARMAGWLRAILPRGTRVMASPAVRARQTAEALGRSFETVAALNTEAGGEDILSAVGWPDGGEAVLVVGHQPSLGEAMALALTGQALPFSVRKASVVWLEHRPDRGARLRGVLSPDLMPER